MKYTTLSLLLILIALGCAGPSGKNPVDPAPGPEEMTEAEREAEVDALLLPVAQKIKTVAGEAKVGLGQFLKDGREYEPAVSRYVIARLTKLLVDDGVSVIERRDLDKVIAELKFQLSDLVDENTRVEIGEISGIDALVLGTVQDLSLSVYRIDIKLEEMATARILMTESVDLNRKYLPVKFGGK